MNNYIKSFFQRGLMFAGFGPVVLAIIYAVLEKSVNDFEVSGTDACLGIISIYLLAFLQAGVTVFNQIEHWSILKSLFFHFVTLYLAYSVCYLINSWIPFEPMVLLIFTAVFIIVYFSVWLTVYFCVRSTEKKLNKKLH